MSWRKEEEEEEQDDEYDESEYKSVDDKIIFLIDARAPMFEINRLGEMHFRNCLRVALEVVKSKIVASDKSSIGVIFFGTQHKDADGSMEGVYTLFPPEVPSATRVRQLQNIIEDPQNHFDKSIGSQDGHQPYCPLREALWVCSQAFHVKTASQKVTDYRRVWIFTNDDYPNGGNKEEVDKVLKVAKDCAETGIEISLWHINRSSAREFNPDLFYSKLLTTGTQPEDAEEMEELSGRMRGAGNEGFDTMMASVRRKQYKKRRLASLLFSLGNGSNGVPGAMAVQLYKVIAVAKKPLHTWLYSRTNEPLKVITKYIDGETGASLDDSSIATYVAAGGKRLPVSADEMKVIKYGAAALAAASAGEDSDDLLAAAAGSSVGLQLLFFAPQSVLQHHWNVDGSYFLTPLEQSITGSIALFSALLQSMALKKLLAVVRFQRTKSSTPRIAVLLPQLEQLDDGGVQTVPPGMNLIPLPFVEEIRNNPLPVPEHLDIDTILSDNADLAEASRDLVKALQLDADFCYYTDIESPAMQQFYAVLQAVALSQSEPEWTTADDKLHADKTGLAAHQEEIDAFQQVAGISAADEDAVKSKKRAAPAKKAAGGAAKKGKKSDADGDDVDIPWKDMAKAGTLMSLTGAQLKEICQSLGLPYSGTKAAQVARISDHAGL